ncbi:hypothetical protein HYU12_04165 [Candidatus Woesearchaeota archaeon]|nr:hypothetical protein [Candidatus Woesearchaeota archaeon]
MTCDSCMHIHMHNVRENYSSTEDLFKAGSAALKVEGTEDWELFFNFWLSCLSANLSLRRPDEDAYGVQLFTLFGAAQEDDAALKRPDEEVLE